MSRNYLFHRMLMVIPSLLGISIILFMVLALAPGDPTSDMGIGPYVPPEVRLALRDKLGLDEPIWTRYVHWVSAMLKGDWGVSFVSQTGVGELILQRLPTTVGALGAAQVLAILVGVPAGLLAAVRPYSVLDQITNTLAFIGFSLPTFLTGLLLILLFSVKLNWLPSVYRSDIPGSGWPWVWEHIRQLIMPVVVLGLFQGASLVRYVRSSVLDVIKLDYVTTARSKGISEPRVLLLHVGRNALIPVLTLIMLQIPTIFGGAIVTEEIFRIPGIGSLLIGAIFANDTPVVMGVTFVFSCLVVVFNLIADILYGWLDPRIALR